MLQKNHHFLFPQTFFGSLSHFDEDLSEDDLEDVDNPWILNLEPEKSVPFQPKIGLFLHWLDDFQGF